MASVDPHQPHPPASLKIAQIRSKKSEDGSITHAVTFHEASLPPEVRKVIAMVRALRKYTAETGFRTTRSQHQALQSLDGDNLGNALLCLDEGTYSLNSSRESQAGV